MKVENKRYFFCGIGGSGMLPLATILKNMGADVSGSDRSLDQGRLQSKFAQLEALGFRLYPQDGRGLEARQTLIASAAIEDTVPDIAAAKALGLKRQTRAECLSELFNASQTPIGVAGTSGKSTTTGMIAHILTRCGTDPTVMNGADMVNFRETGSPFASARVGQGGAFVSEIDESDGSIALYNSEIAVLNNVSEDHKPLAELRVLFGDFLRRAKQRVINADYEEVTDLSDGLADCATYSLDLNKKDVDFLAADIVNLPYHQGSEFVIHHRPSKQSYPARLLVAGRHNVANAMAAISVAHIIGIGISEAVEALKTFKGIARRFEIIGHSNDITIIDDFGHNPDKIAASFRTLTIEKGRVLVMFQPHGFGPLRLMKDGFVACFAQHLKADDRLIMPEPVYYGGTTDRSVSTADIIEGVKVKGRLAEGYATRAECGARLLQIVEPGDRVVIMGARDDTLTEFAKDLLSKIKEKFV